MQEGSRKAIFAAFFANLGIALAKFAGFLLTSSASLLAEAGHSLADTGNQALLLLGGKRAQKRANAEHPFGYGRERYFWAFVVALVLFSMGGLFALYEGFQKLIHPHETENLGIAIAILLFAMVLEGFSLRTAVKEARHVKPKSTSWWSFIRNSKAPELPVVLLEDFGAMIGLVFAMVGVLAARYTHNPRWDAVGSIAIGALLVVIAMVLAVEMKGLLVGEGASPEMVAAIRSSLEGAPHVTQRIDLRTEHLGPDELLVAAKLEFDRSLTIEGLAEAIDGVEALLQANVPTAILVYIEPDSARTPT